MGQSERRASIISLLGTIKRLLRETYRAFLRVESSRVMIVGVGETRQGEDCRVEQPSSSAHLTSLTTVHSAGLVRDGRGEGVQEL